MKIYKRSKIHTKNLRVFLTLTHGQKVQRYHSGSVSRFISKIRGHGNGRINIRVEYGKDKDVFGKIVMFYNEYDGDNKEESISALKAFIE